MPLIYESFQLTLFWDQARQALPSTNAATLWGEHFSVPYQNFQNPAPPFTIAAGQIGNLAYELHLQPGRLDLITKGPDQELSSPSAIKTFEVLVQAGRPLFERIVDGMAFTRVASVVQATFVAKNQQGASERIRERVPILPSSPDNSDQIIQLNVPKRSSVNPAIKLNRVCKWTTGFRLAFLMQIVSGGAGQAVGQEQTWVVDEYIDINTAAETPPDGVSMSDLLTEIIEEITQIAEKGYAHLST